MAHKARCDAVRRSARGAVTLVALCLTTTLGIALASYVALSNRSAQLSNRLLNLDRAQQLAQVGLEEALWALNQNNWSSAGPTGASSWASSGADRTATLSYPLSGQGVSGKLVLKVANYASTGPTWPTVTSAATVTLQGGQTFTKSLQATTGPLAVFENAVASADSYVSFVAGGTVDSWNSDPDNDASTPVVAYSFTAGNAVNYQAVIAGRTNGSNYGVILTQAAIRGYAATFGQNVLYSGSGSPGGSIVGPNTPSGISVDTTRIGKCAFVPLTDVVVVIPPTDTGGNHYGIVHNIIALLNVLANSPKDVFRIDGDFVINGLPLLGPSLTIDKKQQLVIDGDLDISLLGNITITNAGSLELFVSGNVTIGGDGIHNLTKDPKKCAIYCTSTSTTEPLVYSTTQDFCGVIFCENKPIDIRKNATFEGALLSRQYVRFSNDATSPTIHYDAALRNARFTGIRTPYVIKKVTEI